MVTLITVLVLILSILLILVVLIQKPKGGGLTSGLTGGANQLFGVRRTSNIVEKATWIMSGAIALLLLIVVAFLPQQQTGDDDVDLDPAKEIEKALDNPSSVNKPTAAPNFGPGNNSGAADLQQSPADAPQQAPEQ
jgi:preprotein translocase subunit SecG